MYEIIFYEDADGYSSIADSIYTLKKKAATDKSSRINLNKIIAFLDLLQEYGTRIGEPVYCLHAIKIILLSFYTILRKRQRSFRRKNWNKL